MTLLLNYLFFLLSAVFGMLHKYNYFQKILLVIPGNMTGLTASIPGNVGNQEILQSTYFICIFLLEFLSFDNYKRFSIASVVIFSSLLVAFLAVCFYVHLGFCCLVFFFLLLHFWSLYAVSVYYGDVHGIISIEIMFFNFLY